MSNENKRAGVVPSAHCQGYLEQAKKFCADWFVDVCVEEEEERDEMTFALEAILAKAFDDGYESRKTERGPKLHPCDAPNCTGAADPGRLKCRRCRCLEVIRAC